MTGCDCWRRGGRRGCGFEQVNRLQLHCSPVRRSSIVVLSAGRGDGGWLGIGIGMRRQRPLRLQMSTSACVSHTHNPTPTHTCPQTYHRLAPSPSAPCPCTQSCASHPAPVISTSHTRHRRVVVWRLQRRPAGPYRHPHPQLQPQPHPQLHPNAHLQTHYGLPHFTPSVLCPLPLPWASPLPTAVVSTPLT